MSKETTFTYQSNEVTQATATDHTPLSPTDKGGRVRIARFSVTITAGAANDSTIELIRDLPTSGVIIGYGISWADLDSDQGSLVIGTDDGTAVPGALIPDTANIDTTSAGTLSGLLAEPVVLDAPTSVYMTLIEGTAVLAGAVSGYVLYVDNS